MTGVFSLFAGDSDSKKNLRFDCIDRCKIMTTCTSSRESSTTEKTETDKTYKSTFKLFEIEGKGWYLPELWEKQGEGFRNFKSRPDDVWIMTQPRSGTTLTQELVWLLMNNMDFETSTKFRLSDRSVELGLSLFPSMWKECRLIRAGEEDPKILKSVPVDHSKPSYEVYADLPSPRIIKSHFALSVHKNILDSGCKIVYVLRNPKDRLVSEARLATSGPRPFRTGSVQSYIKRYIDDSPANIRGWGPYWPHVKEGWAHRDHPNVLLMYYEELRTDLTAAIKKIAAFLGKSYTDEQVKELVAHLDIDSFRKNPMVNKLPGCENIFPTFIGKGRVGGWNEVLTPELEADVDRWIEENTKDTDIVFPYR